MVASSEKISIEKMEKSAPIVGIFRMNENPSDE